MPIVPKQQHAWLWLAVVLLLLTTWSCSKSARNPAKNADNPSASMQSQVDAARPEHDAGVSVVSAIALENRRHGVAHENVDKPAGTEVAGYSSVASAAPGSTIQLFVNVDHDQSVHWELFRVGYYGGLGMRLVAHSDSRPVTVQPECPIDAGTGLIECDWAPAFDVKIEPEWVSGYYVFELINAAGFGTRVPFIVREGERRTSGLVQASVTTWQAHNRWGGVSLYANERKDGSYRPSSGRVVSFDRPYQSQNEHAPFLDIVRFLGATRLRHLLHHEPGHRRGCGRVGGAQVVHDFGG